jgi:hypothetical protein
VCVGVRAESRAALPCPVVFSVAPVCVHSCIMLVARLPLEYGVCVWMCSEQQARPSIPS